MGARTTLSGVSTLAIMLALMLYFGQFFRSCPMAVLAALILVSTKDLLKQVTVLPKLWKVNKNDFTTWVTTALACVLVDIHYGLLFGVLVSLLSVVNQSQRGWMSVLGKSQMEDLYLDKDDYGGVHEIPGLKIIRMESSLYFATAEKFRKCLYKIIEEDVDHRRDDDVETLFQHSHDDVHLKRAGLRHFKPRCEHQVQQSITEENSNTIHNGTNSFTEEEASLVDGIATPNSCNQTENKELTSNKLAQDNKTSCVTCTDETPQRTKIDEKSILRKRSIIEMMPFKGYLVIIDCLPINFIDGTGLDMLKLVILELGAIDITIYLARCSRYMLRLLEKSDIYEFFPREHVFLDIPDAVNAGLEKLHSVAPFCTHCLEHTCVHMEEGIDVRPKRRSRLMSLPSSHEIPIDRLLTRNNSIFSLQLL